MLIFLLALPLQLALGAADTSFQQDIDRAFGLILRTTMGGAICRDILGANPQAINAHLGVSIVEARKIATTCGQSPPSDWIYPTSPYDIRKLSPQRGHRYQLVQSDHSFPIDSWTDPFSNSTSILTHSNRPSFTRLVQLLTHEMAVYFDSKSHPLLPGAQNIPHLRGLKLRSKGRLDPLLVVSDPMISHSLTYLRALQVEFNILDELVKENRIEAPEDLHHPYLRHLISPECEHQCIEDLVVNLRQTYSRVSLPLLAFASHYRKALLKEFILSNSQRQQGFLQKAKRVLETYPIGFLKHQFTGDVVADLSRVFFAHQKDEAVFKEVNLFLDIDMWRDEQQITLATAKFNSGVTLLMFLKRPLLSGYNILLASGPRVRVRTGFRE